jgi:SPASM domain peptide maturase of grasp-with-spasm system
LCDIDKNSFHLIPDALYKILSDNNNGFIINELIEKYEKEYDSQKGQKDILSDYFDYLVGSDLLIFTDFPEYYMKINLEWDYPGKISNAIIDIEEDGGHVFKFLSELADFGCKFIQIRVYKKQPNELFLSIFKFIEGSIVEALELYIPFASPDDIETYIEWIKIYPRIRTIVIFNSSDNSIVYKRMAGFGQVVTVKCEITNKFSCGNINYHYFIPNINTISESLNHNSCLNRKISIDADGNIKNCPSMAQSFGNIRDTTLQEALDHPEFKKYWNVTKDQIAVCKDCEFRYICTDCRAYIENPEDMYSKPLKCGYNPYTCEWEEWSTNPLKQKAIDYYGMREILPEFKKTISDAGDSAPNPSVE